MNVGFIGLGVMGEPMARNLLRSGQALIVWNRSPGKSEVLHQLGAAVAASIDAVFDQTRVVMLSLLNEQAIDWVLDRGSTNFAARMRGKILVNLGTTSPEYSQRLAEQIRCVGGTYVEAPVSGSRGPAESGQLIGMLAGPAGTMAAVAALLAPLCSEVFQCGEVPNALRMKLAVNHYLIATVTALAETVHAARAANIDLRTLQRVLDAGPMASTVSRSKLTKMIEQDLAPQAAIRDVQNIARLVAQQCADAGASAPIIDLCAALFRNADQHGLGELDMAAVERML
jgi:3-hydroxyisobutyrate dehydrogenase